MSEWTDAPSAVQKGMRRVYGIAPVTWLLSHTAHHLDRAMLKLSGERTTVAALTAGLPIIRLTTLGARSGQARTVPLIAIPNGERLILIASNWGQARHPAWYHNLKANPQVTVSHLGQERTYIAREVSGEERDACWQRAVALYAGYRNYAARAGRVIPVVVLERDGEPPHEPV